MNNLNDGMAWGLFPLLFAASGPGLHEIGTLAATYPAIWGRGQLVTGGLSDRIGRKWLIASGMWVQAAGIALIALSANYPAFAAGSVLLGAGTAMVYPTLLAVIGDVAIRRGEPRRWASIASGATWATRSALSCPASPPTGLASEPPWGSWPQ